MDELQLFNEHNDSSVVACWKIWEEPRLSLLQADKKNKLELCYAGNRRQKYNDANVI